MRFALLSLCLGLLGCFRTIDTGRGGPPPVPFFPDSGPRPDVPVPDSGPVFFDSAVPDASFVVDVGSPDAADTSVCGCVTDADCPAPAPFGCGQAICVAGRCGVGPGMSCDASNDEACDPGLLECIVGTTELNIIVQTEYEPFFEFDRIVITLSGNPVLEYTDLAGDPFEGMVIPPFSIPSNDGYELAVTLHDGCAEVARAGVLFDTESPGTPTGITVSITRGR